MKKPVVFLLGKIPPPYMGPSIATEIILKSSLNDHYRLIHVDTRAHRSLNSMGRWSLSKLLRTIMIYSQLKLKILRYWPSLVIIPVSQSTIGFIKDSIFMIIAKSLFRKTVFHLRGSNFRNWYNKASLLTKWYSCLVLKMADGVVVQGEGLKQLFNGLVADEKLFVVPNGADYPFVGENKLHQPFTILYLANLQASKGIQDLLEAIRLLKLEEIHGFEVNVVGAWRSEEVKRTCVDFVREHGLPVTFHPATSGNAKFEYLKGADVFVFTPREPEGHPWVIVEAQAAGLPIIATAQGAIPDAVEDGKNGFIVGVQMPHEIASRIKCLLNDTGLHQKMAHQSRQTYLNKYTEKKMIGKMEQMIENVIRSN